MLHVYSMQPVLDHDTNIRMTESKFRITLLITNDLHNAMEQIRALRLLDMIYSRLRNDCRYAYDIIQFIMKFNNTTSFRCVFLHQWHTNDELIAAAEHHMEAYVMMQPSAVTVALGSSEGSRSRTPERRRRSRSRTPERHRRSRSRTTSRERHRRSLRGTTSPSRSHTWGGTSRSTSRSTSSSYHTPRAFRNR